MIINAIVFLTEVEKLDVKRYPVCQKVFRVFGWSSTYVKKYRAPINENEENHHALPVLRKNQTVSDGGQSLIKFDYFTLALIWRTVFTWTKQNISTISNLLQRQTLSKMVQHIDGKPKRSVASALCGNRADFLVLTLGGRLFSGSPSALVGLHTVT